MGIIISRFKRNVTVKERLQSISKDISNIEVFRLHTQQKQKAVVARVVLFSVLALIFAGIFLYFWTLPERTLDKFLCLAPFFIAPFLIVFVKRLINWYYARQINDNEIKLTRLREEKKKLLDEVMDKETYKTAKEILEQFAPEQLRKENNQNALVPRVSPQQQIARPGMPMPNLQSAQLVNQELRRRTTTPQVGGQPQGPQGTPLTRNAPLPYPALPQRPAGAMPAGPPMARPILPRDRGVMDKLVEFIVGDGPSNRFALICRQCASHNGMALQEEFEYLAFRCCYCYCWNPARKQRPPAPLLPLPSAPADENGGESSPSSESEAEETAQEEKVAEEEPKEGNAPEAVEEVEVQEVEETSKGETGEAAAIKEELPKEEAEVSKDQTEAS
ncbi:endoplasmic reticulum junction formation protein lunapark-B isoform X2 [Neocloeon triangulifer]|uniref:endoplasmic reticulum junction formation protein lunapark-B isoform X2 n=1 Tax=Neocloeon triangulifer TaxID=2078957 RepID=UPI00286EB55A|nr:endoplasmic reticulum junction formation protein lunapark-B isoform X2 [Neocloeon triangulifer]